MVKSRLLQKMRLCAAREGLKMHHHHDVRSCGKPSGNRRLRGWFGGAPRCAALASNLAFAQDTAPSGAGGVTGDQITKVLGLDGKNLGTGMHFKLGIVLALTGPGSYYGRIQGNGAKLAVAQIKAAGGPDIELVFKDHKSADAQAGARAARELGIDGVSAVLTSYVGDIGAMFPGLAQYKMLALDGGGGTSDFGQSKPFFWGMRAIEPDDDFTGALKYWKATDPKIKRVSLVYIDQGPANEIVIGNFNKALADTGLQLASSEVTTIGATDYSATIARLKSANPDAVFLFNIGVDPGYFMKQFVNAGLTMPVIGAEYISDAAKVAGPAYDNYMFATDWFNAANPTNPWSKLFLDSYVKEFSLEPEINAANYYEDTFAMWDIIRRVLAKGGNVKSGEELQNALIANPKFQSVYGGTASEVGTIELNTTTHSVTKRPLGIYMSNGGKPKQVASFGIGGTDFALIK
jgi:branched-chain amino acid transport system substrate-binding protein